MFNEIEFKITVRRFLRRFGSIMKDIAEIQEKLSKELTDMERNRVFFLLSDAIDNSKELTDEHRELFRMLFLQFVEVEGSTNYVS